MGTSKPKMSGHSAKISNDFEDNQGFLRKEDNLPRVLYRVLTAAQPNFQEIGVSGNFFYMYMTGSPLNEVEIRLDKLSNPSIFMRSGSRIYTPFNKIYMRWETQNAPAWAYFIYGANAAIGKQMLDVYDKNLESEIAQNTLSLNPLAGTQVEVGADVEGLAAHILYTVPANYTLYLCSLHGSFNSVGGTGQIIIRTRDGGDVNQYQLMASRPSIANERNLDSNQYMPPIIIPEGWDIVGDIGAVNIRLYFHLHGYLL